MLPKAKTMSWLRNKKSYLFKFEFLGFPEVVAYVIILALALWSHWSIGELFEEWVDSINRRIESCDLLVGEVHPLHKLRRFFNMQHPVLALNENVSVSRNQILLVMSSVLGC